jgi:hypothetical protein
LTLSGDDFLGQLCIHQPQRSITLHAEEFGTLIIENRRIAGLTAFGVLAVTYASDVMPKGKWWQVPEWAGRQDLSDSISKLQGDGLTIRKNARVVIKLR